MANIQEKTTARTLSYNLISVVSDKHKVIDMFGKLFLLFM